MSEVILSENVRSIITHAIKKYPEGRQQSALKTALMAVQKEQGYLTEPLMDAIAKILNLPPLAVYEVASFYTLYDFHRVGTYKISICTNVSCWLRGSAELMQCLERKLGLAPGETTADGRFTLKEVECLAACGQAPALQINGVYAGPVSVERLEQWLDHPSGVLS